MDPVKDLVNVINEKHLDIIVNLVAEIRSGKIEGSTNVALATVTALENIINDSPNLTPKAAVEYLRAAGQQVNKALPQCPVPANIVRRVLRIVRDEQRAAVNQLGDNEGAGGGESLQRLVLASIPLEPPTPSASNIYIGDYIRDHITELRSELESSSSCIASQAKEHVHGAELLLAYGSGRLLERCLRAAASRNYRLILAEGPDYAQTHSMAGRLSSAGVPVTVVTCASVFAVMSRVNKVVVGARAVLAGGAVLGSTGLRVVTSAAKYYSVPVVVVTPLCKLTPVFACEQHHASWLGSPHTALPYRSPETAEVQVYAPECDFVPSDHITLFITNLGASSPSYVYRLLLELYNQEDYQM